MRFRDAPARERSEKVRRAFRDLRDLLSRAGFSSRDIARGAEGLVDEIQREEARAKRQEGSG